MEKFFFNVLGSWTLANLVSYCLVVLMSILVSFLITRRLVSKLNKLAVYLIVPSTMFILCFAVDPIYESDVVNNFRLINISDSNELENESLSVITIPNCQYCKESITIVDEFIRKTNIDHVNYIVLAENDSAFQAYLELANDKFRFSLVKDEKALTRIADYSFPCFVFRRNDQVYAWSNNGFGNRAKDFITKKMDSK